MADSNNFGHEGNWYTSANIKDFEDKVCSGDRLQFDCRTLLGRGYTRWGIYVGEYKGMKHAVIYFDRFWKIGPKIRADTIGKILGGSGKARINNSTDKEIQPLDPDVITKKAKKMHRGVTPIERGLFVSDFANHCRYNKPCSDQVFVKSGHFTVVSVRYTSANIADLECDVRLGDRLEFLRAGGAYAHWGIYVGEYEGMKHAVIHFGIFEGGSEFSVMKTAGSPSLASQKPEILADTIKDILGGSGKVRINNSRDSRVEPLDSNVIIEVAKKMHQDKMQIDYNLFRNNCEHFVNLCRCDRPISDQLLGATDAASVALFVVLCGGNMVCPPVAIAAAWGLCIVNIAYLWAAFPSHFS